MSICLPTVSCTSKFDYERVYELYKETKQSRGRRNELCIALMPCLKWLADDVLHEVGAREKWEKAWSDELEAVGAVQLIRLVDSRLDRHDIDSGKFLLDSISLGIKSAMEDAYRQRFASPQPSAAAIQKRVARGKPAFKPWDRRCDSLSQPIDADGRTLGDGLRSRNLSERGSRAELLHETIVTLYCLANHKSRPIVKELFGISGRTVTGGEHHLTFSGAKPKKLAKIAEQLGLSGPTVKSQWYSYRDHVISVIGPGGRGQASRRRSSKSADYHWSEWDVDKIVAVRSMVSNSPPIAD